jgi:hypothetical protein
MSAAAYFPVDVVHYWLQVQKTTLFDTLRVKNRYTYGPANTAWAPFGKDTLARGACTVISCGNNAITPSWQLELYDLP